MSNHDLAQVLFADGASSLLLTDAFTLFIEHPSDPLLVFDLLIGLFEDAEQRYHLNGYSWEDVAKVVEAAAFAYPKDLLLWVGHMLSFFTSQKEDALRCPSIGSGIVLGLVKIWGRYSSKPGVEEAMVETFYDIIVSRNPLARSLDSLMSNSYSGWAHEESATKQKKKVQGKLSEAITQFVEGGPASVCARVQNLADIVEKVSGHLEGTRPRGCHYYTLEMVHDYGLGFFGKWLLSQLTFVLFKHLNSYEQALALSCFAESQRQVDKEKTPTQQE